MKECPIYKAVGELINVLRRRDTSTNTYRWKSLDYECSKDGCAWWSEDIEKCIVHAK